MGTGLERGRVGSGQRRVQLTSLVKWRRVTAQASALAVRELIVARRRSRGKRGGGDANNLGRSRQARRGGVAAGREARAGAAGEQSGCGRLSLGVLAEVEQR